ncbi:hypothetical protein GCM10022254_01870 [Actinomadura meridiana]|uniref:Uncharacterized protein n=1 Tax=Actinomadura meridiana TaxID=559626 RepID=A0ABP8BRK7_9ACTN
MGAHDAKKPNSPRSILQCGTITLVRDQDQNTLQGDFGEAWLEAVAAGCGLLHGRPTTVDLHTLCIKGRNWGRTTQL